jgi:lipoate-protein ligase A
MPSAGASAFIDTQLHLLDLLLLQSGSGSPAFNMALDEALLESGVRLGSPILRFYAWNEPAASFGYFQHYSDVERATQLRPLVRRPTGGGLVPHDRDWTYSAVFPPAHPWYSLRATESYRQIHEWIQRAFAHVNVPTSPALETRKTAAGQCFVGHEKFDLLWRGQKVAGAAQRRTRQGLLIQGSIQPPSLPLNRQTWEAAMLRSIPAEVAHSWKEFAINTTLKNRSDELAQIKYLQTAYNQKR